MSVGVYALINKINGRRYIGSTSNLPKRKKDHFGYLRRGGHPCPNIAADFGKFTTEDFEFKVLLFCSKENLLMYEQKAMDAFRSQLYNFAPIAGTQKGVKQTEATRKNVSAAVRAVGKVHRLGKSSAKFKGVNFDARTNTFMARILVKNEQKFLGRYKTDVEAAKVYNDAALIHFGAGCYLNPIPDGVVPMRNMEMGRPKWKK